MVEASLLHQSKVLVVDDTPANVDLLSQILEAEGYRISVAPDGNIALRIAGKVKPDLIMLDIMMPGIDGYEVCRQLKQSDETKDIPVIFITAKTDTDGVIEAFKVGGVDYITKPFRAEEVCIRAKHQVQLRRMAIEREELIKDLEDAKEKIAHEAENKFRFFSGMCDELNKPLNSVIGYADLVAETCSDRQEAMEMAHNITRSGNHLLTLIGEILDFSRIEAGRTELRLREEPLVDLLNDVVSTIEPKVRKLGNEFVFSYPENTIQLYTDTEKLKQVMLALLDYACKFTSRGKITLNVKEDGSGSLFIEVQDTGIGMSPDQMKYLFEPFARMNDDGKSQAADAGLGLSIARSYVPLLGGRINVRSGLNEGTAFSVTVPVRMQDQAESS